MSRPTWIPYLVAFFVLAGSALILEPFASAMLWSGILAMATWPIYKKLCCLWPHGSSCALITTLVLFILILIPCLGLMGVLATQVVDTIDVLVKLHQQGYPPPLWLHEVPWLGDDLAHLWTQWVHEPQVPLVSKEALGQAQSMGRVMTQVGKHIATPFYTMLLSLFLLFFWYRDGNAWIHQYQTILKKYKLQSWETPIASLTTTLRSTVNGTILTSLAMGLILGIVYSILGISASALLGLLSGLLAMIPFALPVLFLGLGLYLAITATWLSGLNLFVGGMILMLISDNIIKPRLIKGHTMPFWMVLLGILGGVNAFGLLGLFLGPMVLASLMLMWQHLYQTK